MLKTKIILGIETSCDETAAAVVSSDKTVLSNIVYSQTQEHKEFGGVVPEIAARTHVEVCPWVVKKAVREANIDLSHIDAVAATAGPGLIGGVLVGMQTAKAIAFARNIPFIGINHLQGHALAARLTDTVRFPFLLLLISGGHTQLLLARDIRDYTILGTTVDDAVGEAFDKVAKILQLGYPGGKVIENRARAGDSKSYTLPYPMKGKPHCNFSFSGLKTRVQQLVKSQHITSQQSINNMCASFQDAVAQTLKDRVVKAMTIFKKTEKTSTADFIVAGGVAANTHIKTLLQHCAENNGFSFKVAPPKYCTDNGAMIAWSGIENLRAGYTSALSMPARPRWSLEAL